MEIGDRRMECFIEPATEVVVARPGVRVAEEGGDLGGDVGVVEEGIGRVWRGRYRGRDGAGKNGGKRLDG